MIAHTIQPRMLRLRDAPHYLGMDVHRFNKIVRPHVPLIRYGKQSVGFDRLDLDAWFEHHKSRGKRLINSKGELWDENIRQDSINAEVSGTSTNDSLDEEFVKILAQARSKKRKNI